MKFCNERLCKWHCSNQLRFERGKSSLKCPTLASSSHHHFLLLFSSLLLQLEQSCPIKWRNKRVASMATFVPNRISYWLGCLKKRREGWREFISTQPIVLFTILICAEQANTGKRAPIRSIGAKSRLILIIIIQLLIAYQSTAMKSHQEPWFAFHSTLVCFFLLLELNISWTGKRRWKRETFGRTKTRVAQQSLPTQTVSLRWLLLRSVINRKKKPDKPKISKTCQRFSLCPSAPN